MPQFWLRDSRNGSLLEAKSCHVSLHVFVHEDKDRIHSQLLRRWSDLCSSKNRGVTWQLLMCSLSIVSAKEISKVYAWSSSWGSREILADGCFGATQQRDFSYRRSHPSSLI